MMTDEWMRAERQSWESIGRVGYLFLSIARNAHRVIQSDIMCIIGKNSILGIEVLTKDAHGF